MSMPTLVTSPMPPTRQQRRVINRYLLTGDHDEVHDSPWPGQNILEKMQAADTALRDALVSEVKRREHDVRLPPSPPPDELVRMTRSRVEPMVRGLFPKKEQDVVLGLLDKSVVFLTPDNIDEALLFDSADVLHVPMRQAQSLFECRRDVQNLGSAPGDCCDGFLVEPGQLRRVESWCHDSRYVYCRLQVLPPFGGRTPKLNGGRRAREQNEYHLPNAGTLGCTAPEHGVQMNGRARQMGREEHHDIEWDSRVQCHNSVACLMYRYLDVLGCRAWQGQQANGFRQTDHFGAQFLVVGAPGAVVAVVRFMCPCHLPPRHLQIEGHEHHEPK